MAREPSISSDITEQELLRRKDFLEFREDDVANLASINDVARRYADAVIEDFYRHLLSFEETRTFFRDPEVLQRVKSAQQEYFLRLTQGKYDLAYAQNRLNIGAIHERIGLPIKAYLGMYNYYLRAVASRLGEAYRDTPERAWSAFMSLMKLTFLDMGLAIDTYINSRERTIREQQEAIQELPTPVLPFREGMLLVPIIGMIDTQRARALTEQLLGAVRDNRAAVGNVAGLLLHADESGKVMREHVLMRNGVVGHRLPPLRAATQRISRGDLLIFATDGVREGFENAVRHDARPQETADRILAQFGKNTDDALVLVGRWNGPPETGASS
jgi:Protoglobin